MQASKDLPEDKTTGSGSSPTPSVNGVKRKRTTVDHVRPKPNIICVLGIRNPDTDSSNVRGEGKSRRLSIPFQPEDKEKHIPITFTVTPEQSTDAEDDYGLSIKFVYDPNNFQLKSATGTIKAAHVPKVNDVKELEYKGSPNFPVLHKPDPTLVRCPNPNCQTFFKTQRMEQ